MKRTFLSLIILFCFSTPAFSLNFSFMEDSPAASFTSADWAIFNSSSEKALNSLPNGQKITWKNPQTGNGGFFQPLTTANQNGTICRKIKIFNQDNEFRTDSYIFTFCKYKGEWKAL